VGRWNCALDKVRVAGKLTGLGSSLLLVRGFLTSVYMMRILWIYKERVMAGTATSIRLDTKLADKAAKVLGVKTRTEAIHIALREIVALENFKGLMKKYGGKASFAGCDE
jgi:Arc/MetJ family transcription regulator